MYIQNYIVLNIENSSTWNKEYEYSLVDIDFDLLFVSTVLKSDKIKLCYESDYFMRRKLIYGFSVDHYAIL